MVQLAHIARGRVACLTVFALAVAALANPALAQQQYPANGLVVNVGASSAGAALGVDIRRGQVTSVSFTAVRDLRINMGRNLRGKVVGRLGSLALRMPLHPGRSAVLLKHGKLTVVLTSGHAGTPFLRVTGLGASQQGAFLRFGAAASATASGPVVSGVCPGKPTVRARVTRTGAPSPATSSGSIQCFQSSP